jgi:hypothetical protein
VVPTILASAASETLGTARAGGLCVP